MLSLQTLQLSPFLNSIPSLIIFSVLQLGHFTMIFLSLNGIQFFIISSVKPYIFAMSLYSEAHMLFLYSGAAPIHFLLHTGHLLPCKTLEGRAFQLCPQMLQRCKIGVESFMYFSKTSMLGLILNTSIIYSSSVFFLLICYTVSYIYIPPWFYIKYNLFNLYIHL